MVAGGRQDAAAKEVVGILDIQGELADSVQASVTTESIKGKRTGGQTGTTGVPEIIVRR